MNTDFIPISGNQLFKRCNKPREITPPSYSYPIEHIDVSKLSVISVRTFLENYRKLGYFNPPLNN